MAGRFPICVENFTLQHGDYAASHATLPESLQIHSPEMMDISGMIYCPTRYRQYSGYLEVAVI
jgi:hypothetical protein